MALMATDLMPITPAAAQVQDTARPARKAAARAERAAYRRWFAGQAHLYDVCLALAELLVMGTAHAARVLDASCAAPQPADGWPGWAAACSANNARSKLQRFAFSLRRLRVLDVPLALRYRDYGLIAFSWGLLLTIAAALLCGGGAAGARRWARLRHPLLLSARLGLQLGILAGALLAHPEHLVVTGATGLSASGLRLSFVGNVWHVLVVVQVGMHTYCAVVVCTVWQGWQPRHPDPISYTTLRYTSTGTLWSTLRPCAGVDLPPVQEACCNAPPPCVIDAVCTVRSV